MVDLALRQSLLEFLDSRIGDLGVHQAEHFQLRESLQVHQSRIGDLGTAQVEPFQLREPL